jgi:hypothetical protein
MAGFIQQSSLLVLIWFDLIWICCICVNLGDPTVFCISATTNIYRHWQKWTVIPRAILGKLLWISRLYAWNCTNSPVLIIKYRLCLNLCTYYILLIIFHPRQLHIRLSMKLLADQKKWTLESDIVHGVFLSSDTLKSL